MSLRIIIPIILLFLVLTLSVTAADNSIMESGFSYIVMSILAIFIVVSLKRDKKPDILDLSYNELLDRLELIVRNDSKNAYYLQSSLRRIEKIIPCEWTVSDSEKIDYEFCIPMMTGKHEKLMGFYALLGENQDPIEICPDETIKICYEPLGYVSDCDKVSIRLSYGLDDVSGGVIYRNLRVRFIKTVGMSISNGLYMGSAGMSLNDLAIDANIKFAG